jgi:hypothetical protein
VTTVAANREVMAADHRVTEDGSPICHMPKLYRIKDRVYGICGDVDAALVFLAWLRAGLDTDEWDYTFLYAYAFDNTETRESFEVMELGPEGLALWNGWGVRKPILDDRYAIGSGGPAALQAMTGKSKLAPFDAVREAISGDQYSGLMPDLEVEEMWLIPPELAPTDKPKKARKKT